MKNPIGWVEIPVSDLDRAEKFYKDFFGASLSRQPEMAGITMSWFEMDMETYGSAATLVHGPGHVPSGEGVLVYFTAPEETVEASLKKAEEKGIKILQPKTAYGEHGFVGCIEDSEGNRIALHSMSG